MVRIKPKKSDVYLLKKVLREQVYSDRSSLELYTDETLQLSKIMERFIDNGVSDSALVVGPSNCGKTSLVNGCLHNLLKKKGDGSFTLIKLNGLIHTNDNLALQEIIRCLHVVDLPEASMVTGSFGDNLNFVLQSLKSGDRNVSKPIIFVMDEFEYFCGHTNQTLLYNLFDTTQTAQAPICVIGITSKIDVVELFEKRVKSRFSHREISLYPSNDHKFYLKLLERNLIIKRKDSNSSVQSLFDHWNSSVKQFFLNSNVIELVQKVFEIDGNLKLLQNILYLLTNRLSEDQPLLNENDFNYVIDMLTKDRKVSLIKDLSILEVGLIITMKHQNEIYECEPMNFEMIYQRYKKYASRNSVNVVAYPVVYKAFERLKELELVVPICGPGRRLKKKEHILYSFVMTDEQIAEALSTYENLPTDLYQWASSSLAVE